MKDGNYMISGNTIHFRKLFKLLGGRFQAKNKAWSFKESENKKLELFLDLVAEYFDGDIRKLSVPESYTNDIESNLLNFINEYVIDVDEDFAESFLDMEERLRSEL